MTKYIASPKSSGGGGFVFEDKACAWFLTHMLTDEAPLAGMGRIDRIHFQVRPDGWLLDDIVLELTCSAHHHLALSVKSNTQFTDAGAPKDFVRVAWEQFLGDVSSIFDEGSDFIGLITTSLSIEMRKALEFVIGTAKEGEAYVLPGRYAQRGWANDMKRTLFESFACPTDLAQKHGLTAVDTGLLLARLCFLQFDFETSPSESEKQALERCRKALRNGETGDAANLWARLLQISACRRPNAGSLDRLTLLDELRHDFELTDLPNHVSDWNRLRYLTSTSISKVRDSIGGVVHLERETDLRELREALNKAGGVVLLGPSGTGKSATAKEHTQRLIADSRKCIWLEATSFERLDFAAFESALQLTHPLQEILRAIPDSEAEIILDGLDRLYDTRAFSLVGALINLIDAGRVGSPWRVVVTCQTQEWIRLQQSLLQAGVSVLSWIVVECEPLSAKALEPVWQAFPQAARLQYQKKLQSIFSNLKILDLIAHQLIIETDVQTFTWVGESSVAIWYWQSQIVHGRERRVRERFMMLLAEKQADDMQLAIPLGAFDVSDLTPLSGLEEDQICSRTDDGRIMFTHDLFGDWARLWVLIAQDEALVHFLKNRFEYPFWHRAIRLYGVYLLEHTRNLERWRSLLSMLKDQGGKGACDLLLESIVFSADPSALLDQVHEDLMRDDSVLLRRLLGRFLAFATLPDPRYIAFVRVDGHDDAAVAARYRYPNWPYWPPVIRFLYQNRVELLPTVPIEIAQIVDLWLDHTSIGSPLRREAAELGLLLGEQARAARNDYGGGDYKHRKLYYRVALTGAAEIPNEVAAFALQASERSSDQKENANGETSAQVLSKIILLDPRYDPAEPVPEPWPDGPRSRVDGDFQEVVLESGALLPLARTRPAIAREVVLASLIKARQRFDWSDHWNESRELDLDAGRLWHPILYINGPFLGFLRINFEEGLETIARLVDFSSERWRFYTDMEARQHEAEAIQCGPDKSSFGQLMNQWRQPSGKVILPLEQGDRELVGDARVYGWSAGLGNPPSAIVAALMALEQYFYLELDEKRPIDTKVRATLERTQSTAFLKPLCDVGKRETSLFEGPLRLFLAMPEVYEWEIQANVQGRQHLMIGAGMEGEWFVRLARAFHEMEHRLIDLRDLAVRFFLENESLREYLSSVRTRWEQRLEVTPEGPFHEFLQHLTILFDLKNYKFVDHLEYGREYVNVRAQELYAERADKRQLFQEQSLLIFLPIRCRRMIDEGTTLALDDLEILWNQVQLVAQHGSEQPPQSLDGTPERSAKSSEKIGRSVRGRIVIVIRLLSRFCFRLCSFFGRSRNHDKNELDGEIPGRVRLQPKSQAYNEDAESQTNALTGFAAMLIRLHPDWLAEHLDRKRWCFEQLRAAVLQPPSRDPMDVPESTADWTWDCFAAEALPVLWAENPEDDELRHLIARVVFAPHYVAVRILFQRCSEYRSILSADFHRLQRLVFELAHIRNRCLFVKQRHHSHESLSDKEVRSFGESVEVWAQERVTAFKNSTLPLPNSDWSTMDTPKRFTMIDGLRAKCFGAYLLDFRLVIAAFEWLPSIDKALNNGERQDWLNFLHAALGFALSRVPKLKERHSYPNEDAQWVLDHIASALPLMTPEEHPEDLWRPVLDLPANAQHWPEDFLGSIHRVWLQKDPVPSSFGQLRTTIIEYALGKGDENSQLKWSSHDDVWQALIGIDKFTRSSWEQRHHALADQSRSLLDRWVKKVGVYSRHLSALAAWLEKDAAASLRMSGLMWLDRALTAEDTKRIYDRESAEMPVASLLQVIWQKDQVCLRQDSDAFAAFRSLLWWLVQRQNPQAQELTRVMGGL